MPRARLEFSYLMPNIRFIPYKVQDTNRLKLIISEYHKTIFRWAKIQLRQG